MYIFLLSIIYLTFISLGLPDSLLGAGWPVMQQSLNVPLSYMGIVSTIISGGTICSSLMSERCTKALTTKYVTLISVTLTAIALFGFSTATKFYILCIWAIPFGLGAGAIDAALNNYIALHYTSKHMSWLHCFWGVGTIFSPYIMSYAITHSVWNNGYRIISFVQLAIAFILLLTIPVWKINQDSDTVSQNTKTLGLKGALKIKGVPLLLTGFFAYCAAEATTMLWATSFLANTRKVTAELAAAFGALFFIGITTGRFISGFVADKVGDKNMIRLGFGITFIGIIFIALPLPSYYLSLAGFIVIGLGCAPIYPCIIHSTPYNFGAENSQGIIGIQMASAYVGSTFMPPVFGLIANNLSLKLLPVFSSIFFILMIIMLEKTFKTVK